MTKNSELFVAGPPLVKAALDIDIGKHELGDYKVHVYESGVVDNVAEDEEDAFSQIRKSSVAAKAFSASGTRLGCWAFSFSIRSE